MPDIASFLKNFTMSHLSISLTDVIEMLILAYVIYKLLVWVKNTRTWFLVKGMVVILGFLGLAILFQFDTILFIAKNSLSVIMIALIVVFQPELRTALEHLGKGNVLMNLLATNASMAMAGFDARTIDELVKASYALGRTRTGALMVIERELPLGEFIRTGIELDALVTSQLLINIFEHNTPLHDGAVIIRGNRVVAATCYLPLSNSQEISKDLGTRHRAALGVSENTDSITIIVSEESGRVSLASEGKLQLGITPEQLREELSVYQAEDEPSTRRFIRWKGRRKHERKTDQ